VVERIALEAPEADALELELQSFAHAVQGQREVVVRARRDERRWRWRSASPTRSGLAVAATSLG